MRTPRLVLSLCAAALLLGTGSAIALVRTASSDEVTNGLQVWYKFDATSGTVAVDSSGHGRNGTVDGTPGWSGTEGLAFNGTDTYVKAPDNLLAGMDSISVSTEVYVDPAQATPYFIYGFGNTGSDGYGNGYLFTTGDAYRTALATGNWSTEQHTGPAAGHALARGVWKHLTYTLTGGTGILYEDGAEVARNTGIATRPGAIGNGVTAADYLGRSD